MEFAEFAAKNDEFAEADVMLSSAMEQLDDLLADSHKDFCSNLHTSSLSTSSTNGHERSNNSPLSNESPPSDIPSSTDRIGKLLEQLIMAIEENGLNARPDWDTKLKLIKWLLPDEQFESPSPSMSTVSCPEYPELQEKLHRLAMARESLSLQVSVLTEQVGAQTEKIKDLESLLQDKRQKLDSTEGMLQLEQVNRTDLVSNKFGLMAEVSNLKINFANLEREKMQTEHRLRMSKTEIDHLTKSMQTTHKQVQMQQQQQQQQQQGQIPIDQSDLTELVQKFRQRSKESAEEIDQLRLAVQQLLTANEEKSQQIDGLRSLVLDQHLKAVKYTDVEDRNSNSIQQMPKSSATYEENDNEFDINQQLRKLLTEDSTDGSPTETVVPPSASYPEGFYYASQLQRAPVNNSYMASVPPSSSMHAFALPSAVQSSSSYTSSLSAISASPQQTRSNSGTPRHQLPLPLSPRSPSSPAARQLAAELDQLRRIGAGSVAGHPPGPAQYYTGSLPRSLQNNKTGSLLTLPSRKKDSVSSMTASGECSRPPRPPKWPKSTPGLNWLRNKVSSLPTKRCTSAPNLVESDDELVVGSFQRDLNIGKFKRDRTRGSLRNLFGRLKRSNSHDKDEGSLFRGSNLRATMSGRVGPYTGIASGPVPLRPPASLFVQWTTDQTCEWLAEIGLSLYVPNVRRTVQSGRHLLTMNQHEMEKELGIRNPLHRKRLVLSLRAVDDGNNDESAYRMDCHQVETTVHL